VKYLIEKNILNGIQKLLDFDESIKFMASIIVAKLTYPDEIEDVLVMNNILGTIQSLFSHAHRTDTLCFLLMR
jgi:hypothetical protein